MNTTEKLKQNAIEYSRNKLNRIMQNGTEDNTIDQKNQNKIEQNILKTELTRTEWEEIEKKNIDRAEESRIEQLCLSQQNKILQSRKQNTIELITEHNKTE